MALAALFLVAALAKFPNRRRTTARMRAFGIPERLAGPSAVLLPIGELAIALLIIPASSARLGAGLAGGALLMFSAVVGHLMARGEAPDCNCFGPLHSSSVGPGMLVRNLMIAGVALVIALVGPGSDLGVSAWVWALIVGLITVLVLGAAAWRAPRVMPGGRRSLREDVSASVSLDQGREESWGRR